MTIGIGGSTPERELEKISDMTSGLEAIKKEEFQSRYNKAINLLKEQDIDAIFLYGGTNLYYFTGTKWYPSERMVAALVFANGDLEYIVPKFEEGTFNSLMLIKGHINCWEEHESPYDLFGRVLKDKKIINGKIAIDETAPFFISDGIRAANPDYEYINGKSVTAECRMRKSDAEIATIQRAKDITITVHKAVARILYPGISVAQVTDFINKAHIKAGAPSGSYFCIVLFAEDSQYPHGVPKPQNLVENDIVLIDTGCQINGYLSDITRTYVYGEASDRHREIWDLEKAAQKAAFDAAKPGKTCSSVDTAARKVLEAAGLGPDYKLPGLPHRVGHGTGLDIHEYPYLVRSDMTELDKGMVLSNEPMICVPGEFGIRHEDHFYITDDSAKWFTEPMYSIDDPFGYEK